MSLKELLKKTTITFPRPIDRKEIEKLCFYMADNLPANLTTKISYYLSCHHIDWHVTEDKGTLKVDGNVNCIKIPGFDSFQSCPWEEDSSYISSINFQLVSGRELSEYGSEKIQLWDSVRNVIDKYFREVSQEKNSKGE